MEVKAGAWELCWSMMAPQKGIMVWQVPCDKANLIYC